MNKLSVIIPTCNEKINDYLLKIVQSYPENPKVEFIVVDSGSPSHLLKQVTRCDFTIFSLPNSNRAERINYGLSKSSYNFILLHHPRSLLEIGAINYLLENQTELSWGGFTHKFDLSNLGLKFTSWYSNTIRPKASQVLYLDHCIFFKKSILTQAIPDIAIFEDTAISKILRRYSRPKILPFTSTTSAIRFQTNGFFKQSFMNQILKLCYFLGVSNKKMNIQYEKDLDLNGSTDHKNFRA